MREESRTVVGYYVACSGKYLTTFRDNLTVHLKRKKFALELVEGY